MAANKPPFCGSDWESAHYEHDAHPDPSAAKAVATVSIMETVGGPEVVSSKKEPTNTAAPADGGQITGWRNVDGVAVFTVASYSGITPNQEFVRHDDYLKSLASTPSAPAIDALKRIKLRLHFLDMPSEPMWRPAAAAWVPDWRYEIQLIEHVLHGRPITAAEKPTDTRKRIEVVSSPVTPVDAPTEVEWMMACNEIAGPGVAEEIITRAYSIAELPRSTTAAPVGGLDTGNLIDDPLYLALDALYQRGWTDLHQKRKNDPRGAREWQSVLDLFRVGGASPPAAPGIDLEQFRALAEACEDMRAASEECDIGEGLAHAVPFHLWNEFLSKLDAARQAVDASPKGCSDGCYFSADPAFGEFITHTSLQAAIDSAESMLSDAGDDAHESGWTDDPPQICYGVVLGQCVEVEGSRKPAPEGSEFTEHVEFKLQATSAEVGA